MTAPDGTHVVETSDIMRFVGQRVGMAPPEGTAADDFPMIASDHPTQTQSVPPKGINNTMSYNSKRSECFVLLWFLLVMLSRFCILGGIGTDFKSLIALISLRC